jgi:CheY-like chemotaxis protein
MVVRLPVSSKAPSSDNARADLVDDRRTASSKFRVLVVDDNIDSAESIVKLLQLHGHDARCAFNGASALLMARQFEPDLILLDISLPDMDGYEVLRQLREQSPASRPFVAAVRVSDNRKIAGALGKRDSIIIWSSPSVRMS